MSRLFPIINVHRSEMPTIGFAKVNGKPSPQTKGAVGTWSSLLQEVQCI